MTLSTRALSSSTSLAPSPSWAGPSRPTSMTGTEPLWTTSSTAQFNTNKPLSCPSTTSITITAVLTGPTTTTATTTSKQRTATMRATNTVAIASPCTSPTPTEDSAATALGQTNGDRLTIV